MKKLLFFIIFIVACSPLKSSPKEEQHQLDLTLHELQTNMDDLKHDLHSLQAELQILDEKVASNSGNKNHLREDILEAIQTKIDFLTKEMALLTSKTSSIEKKQESIVADVKKLAQHSNELSYAVSQNKEKVSEIENNLVVQGHRLEDVNKLKGTLEVVAKSLKNPAKELLYHVKIGDSLEKIAKLHKVSIEDLKRANHLKEDLIVVGQELIIPK